MKEHDGNIRKIELLAPAQNKEAAFCAINYGADSVYIGANRFGARKNAGNSTEDIKEVIDFAHKFGAKVYVTVNTIVSDSELEEAKALIEELYRIKADGIIFQDFGILELAAEGKAADIKLIASTQCDIRDKEKVKFFESAGVKRVILARELGLEDIEDICKSTNAEVETFIHGALCVSYSGQCYLSHKIGKRSANRGECAQACRKKYTLVTKSGRVIKKDKYLLSLKDFMGAKYLERLIDIGVTSFKIEGRLKDENYIKNTVGYYRKLLDKIIENRPDIKKASGGKIFLDFEPQPEKSFNRGFCEYFLNGRKDDIFNFDTPNSTGEYVGFCKGFSESKNGRAQGFSGKAEGKFGGGGKYFILNPAGGVKIHPQDGLCYMKNGVLRGFLVNSVKEEGDNFKVYPNISLDGEISSGTKIYRNKDFEFEKVLNNSKTKRCLGVRFYLNGNKIWAKDEDGNTASAVFEAERAKDVENAKRAWQNGLLKCGNSDFYASGTKFLSDDIYFLPTSQINALRNSVLDKIIKIRLENYATEGQGKIKPAKYPSTVGDYRLNVHNSRAVEFYEKCGCRVLESSYESGRKSPHTKQTKKEDSKKAPAELMRTKHCIRFALNMCLKGKNAGLKNVPRKGLKGATPKWSKEAAGEELYLQDEMGEKYLLCFDCKNCEMIVKECNKNNSF